MKLAWRGREFDLVRPARPAYVLATWMRSYCDGIKLGSWRHALAIPQRAVATALYPRVMVIVDPGAPNTIHGWACADPGVLHYLFVAEPFRRMGLGRALAHACAGESGVSSHLRPRALVGSFHEYPFDRDALAVAIQARTAA